MDSIIEKAWTNRALLEEKETQHKIRDVIENLDKGKVRVAEKKEKKMDNSRVDKKICYPLFCNSKNGNFKSWTTRIS